MKEIIDCIPSAALREYLSVHPLKLSVLQKATIVDRYAKRKKQIAIFRKLLKEAKFRGYSEQRLRTWKITLTWREVT